MSLDKKYLKYKIKYHKLKNQIGGEFREIKLNHKGKDLTLMISTNYFCPLTKKLFVDPVLTVDGETYEKEAIESWFRKGDNTSPNTKVVLPNQTLIPNIVLKKLLNELIEEEYKKALSGSDRSNLTFSKDLFTNGITLYKQGKFNEAYALWNEALKLDNILACAFLADMLIDGRNNVPKDEKTAFELASHGTSLDSKHCKGILARCLVFGIGVEKNIQKGLELGRESEAAGSLFGRFIIGKCNHQGLGMEKNFNEAKRLYTLAAEEGHAAANTNLGNMFENGEGSEVNYDEAERYYRLGVAHGLADAQTCLGVLLEKRFPQKSVETRELYQLAAAQGNPIAQVNLGIMFQLGIGGERSIVNAEKLYREAIKQNYLEGEYRLAEMIYTGLLTKDFGYPHDGLYNHQRLGIEAFKNAAEKGNLNSQLRLGLIYLSAVIEYRRQAFRYLKMAADQNSAEAKYRLGIMYYDGVRYTETYSGWLKKGQWKNNLQREIIVTERDWDMAERLWTQASEQGHQGALDRLNALKSLRSRSKSWLGP
jgi:TPR repeat protein